MTHSTQRSSDEISGTTHAIVHGKHDPYKEYFVVWAILMALLVVTILAAQVSIPEPWSFVVALIIAVIKAVLVILFFMHVKDASRVTWVFCGGSFLWLAIMLVLTFSDYITRTPGQGTPIEGTSPTAIHRAHEPSASEH